MIQYKELDSVHKPMQRKWCFDMEKTKVIMRAKSYLEMLSNGIDPISGNEVPEDSVLTQERLRKCFSFVTELLTEAINNHGLISLPENEQNSNYEIMKKKAAFSMRAMPKQRVLITEAPISTTAFVRNINAAVDKDNMEKLSTTVLNKWLTKYGFLTETKEPATINKTVRHVTPEAACIGIMERQVVDKKTGKAKSEIVFNKLAQEYILSNFDAEPELLKKN